MSGEIKIEENANWISLEVSGETLPFTIIREKLTETVELAKKSHKGIIIIRREIPVQIGSAIEFFRYAELIDPTFDNKIALVLPKEMHTSEMLNIELYSIKKEWLFRLFSEKQEAVMWLRKKDDGGPLTRERGENLHRNGGSRKGGK